MSLTIATKLRGKESFNPNAWDVEASVFVQSVDFSAVETIIEGLAWSDAGDKLFIYGSGNDDLHELTVTKPFDISTATLTDSAVIGAQLNSSALSVKPDGTVVFVMDDNSGCVIYEYTYSVGWDLSSTQTFNGSTNLAGASCEDIWLNREGTILIVNDDSANSVRKYDLSTPWDVSTAVADPGNSFSFSVPAGYTPNGCQMRPDGLAIYVTWYDLGFENFLYQYDLLTPFDLTTIQSTPAKIFGLSANETIYPTSSSFAQAHLWHPDGKGLRYWIAVDGEIFEYKIVSSNVNFATIEEQQGFNSGAYVGGTTRTYASAQLGALPAAGQKRYIIVAEGGTTSSTNTDVALTSMTINGVSATKAVGVTSSAVGSFFDTVSIWYAEVPTGTTGDIVVTQPGTASRSYAQQVYSVYIDDGRTLVVDNTYTDDTTGGARTTLTLNPVVPNSSFAIATFFFLNGQSNPLSLDIGGTLATTTDLAVDSSAGNDNFYAGVRKFVTDTSGTIEMTDIGSSTTSNVAAAAVFKIQ